MTNQPDRTPTRTRRPGWLLAVLGLTLLAATAVGAYYDWYLWHPMSGIMVTLAGAALILVGGLAVLVRSRRVRPIALVLIVAGIGTIVGQTVGPDRPATFRHETGSMHLVLTSPITFDASGPASCGSAADGSQVAVAPGSFGMARASDEADFHYPSVTIGDMYDYADPNRRNDHLNVSISVQQARIPADIDPNAAPGETIHRSDRASNLTLAPGHSVGGGSISFSNLALGVRPDAARRSDLVGTISWTCGPVTLAPGTDEDPSGGEQLPEEPLPTDVPEPS
ncbi:MAG: hypothetical protein M3Q66_07735 [Chloroflexota bacterium]|nr:hypothetical protein [Chloroflexota bacterium]